MGVMRDNGPTKPRPPMAAPSPRVASRTAPTVTAKATVASSAPSPRAASRAAPAVTVKTSPAPPACRKEEEKLRGTSAQSSVKSTVTHNKITTNNVSRTKASEAKNDKNSEEKSEKNETENNLVLALCNISLNEDNDLNNQIKNLSIKDDQKEKEENEESDLLSRGPDRVCTTANSRTVPYFYEQRIVSSDNHGGGTVLYPDISSPQQVTNYPQDLYQDCYAANLQNSSQDTVFTAGNSFSCLNSVLKDALSELPAELPPLTEEDLKILQSLAEEMHRDCSLTNLGAMDGQQLPPSPDSGCSDCSDYSSDFSVGSPSSVMSGVMRTDTEKVVTTSAQVIAQPTNLHTQIGIAPAPISPVVQTLQPGMLVVLQQQPKTVMPPPPPPPILLQPQQQTQPLAPPPTPPLSPQVLRPILPGVNIPDAMDGCSEPAINRIRMPGRMVEQMKDRAWAIIFAYPETKLTDKDEYGNMFLSRVLSNWKSIKYFMEVFHALIQRLKEIINHNKQIAYKLLATPNKSGHTPLDIACRFLRSSRQNAVAVRYLADTMVEEGLAIGKEVDANGNSLIHKLCASGDDTRYIMAELLNMKDQQGKRVFDVNQKNNEGKTPLHIAAQTHSDRISCTVLAQLLMRSGADISVKDGCAGNTVFHLVARESCDPNLLVMLLAKTSYASNIINEKNFNEDTPLHMVAANHSISPTRQRLAVQHLIESGADPKIQNKSRKAPLSLVPTERKQDIKNVLYHKRQVISQ
ncbi:NF-kappa-B inhibitor zeta-like isoform X2 [Schistocerca gregaria]|uniref:NF-kappa-B inhibitor zeta-like isoform X2 n=1 Tax=Schistocerca gregaria TaxID=7010 RepID=UPI00211E9C04|nr:NF-kappa-B inhibitor zeta-like isoform X2 [Schistocerca gregaria]XP_049840134.1 NF-kappa-B inhibitor zeta-like isoform X2 [Schistocerca gregaria]